MAAELYKTSTIPASLLPATDEELRHGKEVEEQRNSQALQAYQVLVQTLVNLIEAGKL